MNSCVRDVFSVQHDSGDFLKSVHMTCREDAGSGFSQSAEFHILLWTGTKRSYYLHPSVSAKLGSGKKRSVHQLQLRQRGGSVFGWISFSSHFLLLPPSLTMNLLVLRDPSRSKQAVTSASSLKRKGCQNLNIYSMQCETKILVLLVSLFWGLFIAVPCVFLGVVQQNKTSPKQKALLGLRFSSPSASCSAYSTCMFLCLS